MRGRTSAWKRRLERTTGDQARKSIARPRRSFPILVRRAPQLALRLFFRGSDDLCDRNRCSAAFLAFVGGGHEGVEFDRLFRRDRRLASAEEFADFHDERFVAAEPASGAVGLFPKYHGAVIRLAVAVADERTNASVVPHAGGGVGACRRR